MKRLTRSLGLVAGAATLAAAVTPTAALAEVVVPQALNTVEGNSVSEGPFEALGQRFQQVYNASAFDGSPITITGLSFRADSSVDAPLTTTRGADGFPVEVTLSTTSASADSLSSIFAGNLGEDATTVFSGTVTLSTGTVGGSPNDFSSTINFSNAFTYDPSMGNLLVEITKASSDLFADPLPLDAEDTMGDAVSSLSGLSPIADQGIASSLGLVTQFEIGGTVIPTPTAAIMGLGLIAVLGLKRRRQA